jgi:hypothetical protein
MARKLDRSIGCFDGWISSRSAVLGGELTADQVKQRAEVEQRAASVKNSSHAHTLGTSGAGPGEPGTGASKSDVTVPADRGSSATCQKKCNPGRARVMMYMPESGSCQATRAADPLILNSAARTKCPVDLLGATQTTHSQVG